MIHVGGKPILEQIIDGFVAQGFLKFWLCVNYKADLIEAHFGAGKARTRINYVRESEPLGTGGALRLLPKFEVPFIVANADVLTHLSYGALMEHHARSNAPATVCLALHQYQVPYGVAEFEDGEFSGIAEKPVENALVNAGIYVIEPRAMASAPEGAFDMPDFLSRARRSWTKRHSGRRDGASRPDSCHRH